jgi:UDP-N-acetylmuramate dehydrogenase
MSPLAQQSVTLLPASDWVTAFQVNLGQRVQRGVLMSHYTSMGIGGPAALLGRARNDAEMAQMVVLSNRNEVEVLVVDDGQNLLVGDWGFDGFALRLEGDFNRLTPVAGGLSVGGACSVGRVLDACLAARLDAMMLAPLDGQIGAALLRCTERQREAIEPLVERVEMIDIHGRLSSAGRLSDLPDDVLTITRLQLRGAAILDDAGICDRVEARRMLIRSRRPQHPHLGVIFKMEDGSHAATAIRKVGLAGMTLGQVGIPKSHPDTLINLGGATAREALDLIDCVAARLRGRLGLNLNLDLRLVGSF